MGGAHILLNPIKHNVRGQNCNEYWLYAHAHYAALGVCPGSSDVMG